MIAKVTLETKELREILSVFFDIPISDVEPNRYSYSIRNMTAEEMEAVIRQRKREKQIPSED